MFRKLIFILVIILSPQLLLAASCRCQPNEACWPSNSEWDKLAKQLKGHLIRPVSTLESCKTNQQTAACKTALKNIYNPYFNESQPGATQSQGWLKAWNTSVSTYAVEAESTADVVAAVNFAREHHLKLVIKGTGHDYLGRSNAPNSLLIWTHQMRDTEINNSFIPNSCPSSEKPISVITVGAGTRWIEAYTKTTTENHRYVQGGGCATVGAAGGFTQGGGFGSYSKKFGTGAAGIIEAEIVLANGNVVIANKCQHQDLFWAIKGGGASTFGVVTKLTLLTHELPNTFGNVKGSIVAKTDDAYKQLLDEFVRFYPKNLNNEHWGEQITFTDKNTVEIAMVFQDLSKDEVIKVWEPIQKFTQKYPNLFQFKMDISLTPPWQKWDYKYLESERPDAIKKNTLPGAKNEFWWASNSSEVSAFWYTYQSWWLPITLFKDTNSKKLAEIFFKASRLAPVTLHVNKGLSGASEDAVKRTRETATNPSVLNAAVLVIMASGTNKVLPGLKGYSLNENVATQEKSKIDKAMQLFMNLAPDAGAYVNEADYFLKNWQQAFWGRNYAKLLELKNTYDPDGLFYCHHCVGSESWNENGMCKIH